MRVRSEAGVMLGAVILAIAALRRSAGAAVGRHGLPGRWIAMRAGLWAFAARRGVDEARAAWRLPVPPYVGTDPGFARLDRLYYSPLWLLLGATGLTAAAARI